MTAATQTSPELRLLVDGVDFGEGPRWHDGRLWYSDFYQRAIYSVTTAGERTAMFDDLDDRPSGLGWMPDGSLLAVAMTSRSVWREADGALVRHADLSAVASGHCNDMVVDAAGNAYVGNFGFDFESGGTFALADLALVRPHGSVEVAAEGLAFPNGSVITRDGSTLIVGESFGGGYVAFDIADDATLSNRRVWASIPGTAPDGCALDADGAIWFSDALGSQVVRVLEGGEVTHRVGTPMPTYACALGGDDRQTLFVLCAPATHPDDVAGKALGAIFTLDLTRLGDLDRLE
ncbi:MAG: SMP-30/gluconolactonase/LRE family protein [Ilumatobacteraceae bacterium]